MYSALLLVADDDFRYFADIANLFPATVEARRRIEPSFASLRNRPLFKEREQLQRLQLLFRTQQWGVGVGTYGAPVVTDRPCGVGAEDVEEGES